MFLQDTMAADQVNQVIDKLCEKLGVAVDKLQPLSEEIIRQVSITGWIKAGVSGFVTIIVCFMGFVVIKYIKNNAEDSPSIEGACMFLLILLVAFVISLLFAYNGLCQAVAPHLYLFEKIF